MMRLLATLLALLTLGAVPAVASAKLETFRSPSGKIGCMFFRDAQTPSSVRCDWRGGGDHAVFVEKTGKGRKIGVTDTVMDPGAPVLDYGKTRRFGSLKCTSRKTGMTCKNSGGHGFTVSVERRKVF
jgi:hypothetical protein